MGLDRAKFPYSKEALRMNTFDVCCPEDKEKIVSEIFNEVSLSIKNEFKNIKIYKSDKK